MCCLPRTRTEQPCQIIMDGVLNRTGEVRVQIRKADVKARFIRFSEQQFLTRLRQKQAEWNEM